MKKLAVIKADSESKPVAMGLKSFHLDEVTREVIAAARRQSADMIAQCEAMAARAEELAAQAARDAEAIRESARRDAEAIRETARQEGDRAGYDAGFKRGTEEGRTQALEAARQEFARDQAHLAAAFRATMDTVERGRDDWLAAARQDLIELAMAIARRVVRHVGQRDRDVVLANLEEAVRLVGVRSNVTIAVHPADADAARIFAQSLLDLREHWEHIQVVEEPEIARGGCRVHWGSGSVDAALETQLDRIEAELQGE